MTEIKIHFVAICIALLIDSTNAFAAKRSHTPLFPRFNNSDAQIAAVVLAINDEQIMQAKVVLDSFLYSLNHQFREFAKQLASDSEQSNADASAVLQRDGIAPEDNELSGYLLSTTTDRCAYYNTLDRPDLYDIYSHDQVFHDGYLLTVLNEVLIPNVKNEELKKFILQQMGEMIERHLNDGKILANAYFQY